MASIFSSHNYFRFEASASTKLDVLIINRKPVREDTRPKSMLDVKTQQLLEKIKEGLLEIAGAPMGQYLSLEVLCRDQTERAVFLIQLINLHSIDI